MNKKCIGCGVTMQDNNILLEGYTQDLKNDLCRRCFRMKNYGEYEQTTIMNNDYIEILKKIGTTESLVLYIVDLLSIPNDLMEIKEYLKNNKVILVLNKRDVLPLSVKNEKLIAYFKDMNLGFLDIILISANTNYNLDHLMNVVDRNKKNNDVYVVGYTNAGKSSLINKLIKSYSDDIQEGFITISPMPSTTLNEIRIKLNRFYLIDTPGLVDNGNILNYVPLEMIKKISPYNEIKPRVYQIKKGQALIIEDFFRIDYAEGEKNSFTLFISNELKVKRINGKKHNYLTDLFKETIDVRYHEDIVINGLGFIKIISEGTVEIYYHKDIEIFKRKSLI